MIREILINGQPIEQGSHDWHNQRHGCVTGTFTHNATAAKLEVTRAKKATAKAEAVERSEKWVIRGNKKAKCWRDLSSVQQTYLFRTLAGRSCNIIVDDYESASMQRGNEAEPHALAEANKELGLNFVICGMIEDSELASFKMSPDAVLWDRGVLVGGLEIKCPEYKTHVEYCLKNEIPKDYLMQMLTPMIMNDSVKSWWFCSYDDRNKVQPIFLKELRREEYKELIQEAREILKVFIEVLNKTEKDWKEECQKIKLAEEAAKLANLEF